MAETGSYVWDEVLEVNRLAKCISLEGHWEAMLVLPEAVRATVRMVFPEISFLTAVHQAGNSRVSSRTPRRQNAWGLLSRGMWARGKREEGRWGTSHAGVARNAILGSPWRVGSVGCGGVVPASSSICMLEREDED